MRNLILAISKLHDKHKNGTAAYKPASFRMPLLSLSSFTKRKTMALANQPTITLFLTVMRFGREDIWLIYQYTVFRTTNICIFQTCSTCIIPGHLYLPFWSSIIPMFNVCLGRCHCIYRIKLHYSSINCVVSYLLGTQSPSVFVTICFLVRHMRARSRGPLTSDWVWNPVHLLTVGGLSAFSPNAEALASNHLRVKWLTGVMARPLHSLTFWARSGVSNMRPASWSNPARDTRAHGGRWRSSACF